MSRTPSVQAILGGQPASASGIVERKLTGERVIVESRRADGRCVHLISPYVGRLLRKEHSIRKERKVRPGYTPPEDVEKFKSARQQDADRRALPKGMVPGMASSAISAARAAQEGSAAAELSKSAKKNAKRREKKDEDDRPPASNEPVKDSWDEEEDETASASAPTTEAIPEPVVEAKEVDPEKAVKKVEKKLRQVQPWHAAFINKTLTREGQAEALRDRSTKGEKLLPEQEEKVASIPSLEEELEKLKV